MLKEEESDFDFLCEHHSECEHGLIDVPYLPSKSVYRVPGHPVNIAIAAMKVAGSIKVVSALRL